MSVFFLLSRFKDLKTLGHLPFIAELLLQYVFLQCCPVWVEVSSTDFPLVYESLIQLSLYGLGSSLSFFKKKKNLVNRKAILILE